MALYAVGDIQGCYDALRRLLDKLSFDPDNDQLWVAGDLVNRGPESLETLRYLKNLGSQCTAVLGNHDLHLLAVAANLRQTKKKDTLDAVLTAIDSDELLHWLRHRPILHHDTDRQVTMVHAGIPPMWTIKQAIKRARKLEAALQSDDYEHTLHTLFKTDKPRLWSNDLSRKKKLRLTASYFTQMRFCTENGLLDLNNKTAAPHDGYAPWFTFPKSPSYRETIIFGHWAALEGKTGLHHIHAIDTGCVWGKHLTALNLDTFERIQVENP
ncbi:bis(5'-nucleosyl)-tetraphosphatase (symmetrical) [Endozoicomonas sp. (ex Bugula neritina AB1)]|nr:bis(5'-nucleosyl)-tetraphosphatase (symmetrical) [Endozoicomonas sp. (ex Bugula neritina AB1)]